MGKRFAVTVDRALDYIENNLDKRQVNKIQHAFPSPRYWAETAIPTTEVLADRRRMHDEGRGMPINLYLGVPYCIKTDPGNCGYCLFPVEDFEGNAQLEEYFGYLKREVSLLRDGMRGLPLGQVYLGGGTSNLYKAPAYFELMGLIR